MANERRSDDRIRIDVSARIFNAPGEVVLGEGRIMDVSTGGAKLITSAELLLGDVLQLEFTIHEPDRHVEKDKLTLTSEVETVWKEGEEKEMKIYGVRFVNMSELSKGFLTRLVGLLEKSVKQDKGE